MAPYCLVYDFACFHSKRNMSLKFISVVCYSAMMINVLDHFCSPGFGI